MQLLPKLPKEHVFQESDSDTCGPCCIAMIYAMKGKKISVKDILRDLHQPSKGLPTWPSQLARHLLKNSLKTKLIFSNSQILSPAWKDLPKGEIIEYLKEWLSIHTNHSWYLGVLQTLFFLQEGGTTILESYTTQTLKDLLDQKHSIITGVDEDWLWGHRFKKVGEKRIIDEVGGKQEGHFVLLTGYSGNKFHVLDPFPTHIEGKHGSYDINENQLLNASLFWGSTLIVVE